MSPKSSLSSILVEAGVIDSDQEQGYLTRSKKTGQHFAKLLLNDSICSEEDISQAVSLQLGIPPVSLTQLRIPGYLAKLLSRELAEKHIAIPVSEKKENDSEFLYVAFFDPTDSIAMDAVQKATNKKIKPVVSTLSDIEGAIKRYIVPLKRTQRRKTDDNLAISETENALTPKLNDRKEESIKDMAVDLSNQTANPLPMAEPIETADILTNEEDLTYREETQQAVSQDDTPIEIATKSPEVDLENFMDDLEFEAEIIGEKELENSDGDSISGDAEIPMANNGWDDVDFDSPEMDISEDSDSDDKIDLTEGGSVDDFLAFDSSELSVDDDTIEKEQEEAANAKQEVAFGVDLDTITEETVETSSEEIAEENVDDLFASFESTDASENSDGRDIDPDNSAEWSSDDFELDGELLDSDVPGEVDVTLDENADQNSDDGYDDFDFDIPEAPDFQDSPSAEFKAVPVDPDKISSENDLNKDDSSSKNQALTDDKWSLDLDTLFKQTEIKAGNGQDQNLDFDTAAAELDALLGDDEDEYDDQPIEANDVLAKLFTLQKIEGNSASSADIQEIIDFVNGVKKPDDETSDLFYKAIASVSEAMMSAGIIDNLDFLKTYIDKHN